MRTSLEARRKLLCAWPFIVDQCRRVLGSELHYQAMVYHCLRAHADVPLEQIGMNVKMTIDDPVSEVFKRLMMRRHELYRGGFEPIPDICLFSPDIAGDWRRRSSKSTLNALLLAVEIKASERAQSRLRSGEIRRDIEKLAAHLEEAVARKTSFAPVVLVIDTAPDRIERMTQTGLDRSMDYAAGLSVGFMYVSPNSAIETISALT